MQAIEEDGSPRWRLANGRMMRESKFRWQMGTQRLLSRLRALEWTENGRHGASNGLA